MAYVLSIQAGMIYPLFFSDFLPVFGLIYILPFVILSDEEDMTSTIFCTKFYYLGWILRSIM